MPKIVLKEHEHFEAALRRFKRAVESSGIMQELRERQAYEKPSIVRKREHASAVKRQQKKRLQDIIPHRKH